MFKNIRILICVTLFAGCSSNHSYKIVGARSYWDKEADEGNGGQMLVYTLEHDGQTIKAHCQAWDVHNNCYHLEVGKSYDLLRNRGMFDTLCLYDRTQNKDSTKADVTLVVEEEKIGQ